MQSTAIQGKNEYFGAGKPAGYKTPKELKGFLSHPFTYVVVAVSSLYNVLETAGFNHSKF